jgi:hypothetical protein
MVEVPDLPSAGPPGGEAAGRKSLGPHWLEPSVTVESEYVEGLSPRSDVESKEVKGGVIVSPGKKDASPGDVSIKVEGGMRENVYQRERDAPQRSPSVGVGIEIPWPNEKAKKREDQDAKE